MTLLIPLVLFWSLKLFFISKLFSCFLSLRTFAPVWDVFKTSTEKLANCHLDLVRKLQELIKEVQKYGEEQVKSHKKVSLFLVRLFGQILSVL